MSSAWLLPEHIADVLPHEARRIEELRRILPEWLTRRQAATAAGVAERTIDRWRADKTLTTYRAGDGTAHRPVLVSRDDLIAVADQSLYRAKKAGGELPTRQEQVLLHANCKQHFEKNWYWSGETVLSEPGWSWFQSFSDGNRTRHRKSLELRARAVRRLPI